MAASTNPATQAQGPARLAPTLPALRSLAIVRPVMLERLGLLAVALLAAGLYLWDLPRNGWANEYYAAAVFSMTQNLHNFFYGTLDPAGFITVDKPPLAFWIQALSARIFGFGSWSILAPQALAGVAGVLVLYRVTRRTWGPAAGLLAALLLAIMPTAVVVNRDNLPDSVLTLLMMLAAWATLSATISGRTRWLLLAGALIGLAFNTKMLQAYIVVPALALTYLVAAPPSFRRRVAALAGAGLVMLVVSASWMMVVDAVPPDQRPYIGGSANNTVLDLVVGYNGLGRILGNQFPGLRGPGGPPPDAGSAALPAAPPIAGDGAGAANRLGPPGGGPGFGGAPGPLRMFNAAAGPHIGWLLPLAGISLVAGLVDRRGKPRTDPARAGYLLWGGWLLTHFVVFSFARGIFHEYYTIAMAPAVAALSGSGLLMLWRWYRQGGFAALVLPIALVLTADTAFVIVSRTSWGEPWLGTAMLVGGAAAGAGLLAVHLFRWPPLRRLAAPGLAAGLAAVLIGPVLWSFTSLASPTAGVMPNPGPVGAFGRFGPGRGVPGAPPFGPGGPGQVSDALIAYLTANQGSARYLVATTGSMSAAPLILKTGKPILPMGGFSGGDPAPTADQLAQMVARGELRFVLAGGPGAGGPPVGPTGPGAPAGGARESGAPGGPAGADRGGPRGADRMEWVRAHCRPIDLIGQGSTVPEGASRLSSQLYDCAPMGANPWQPRARTQL